MSDVIVASGLTKVYGKTIAVNWVNLRVKKGGIFGFLGLNGAGKPKVSATSEARR